MLITEENELINQPNSVVAPGLYCRWPCLGPTQGRLTINNRYTQREFKLKFSALQKDDDLQYTENSKK